MKKIILFFILMFFVSSSTVFAWDTYGGIYRDYASEAFISQNNAMMQQMQANINQGLQVYERENRDALQAEYQAYQSSGVYLPPYQQFVYNHMMSGGGSNPQAVLNQGQAFGRVMDGIHRDNEELSEEINRNWWVNQQIKDDIHQRGQDAFMGQSQYFNPYTNQPVMLPYGPSGYEGGYYTNGTGSYMYTPGGIYQVYPDGFTEPMEPMESNTWWESLFE